MAGLPGLTAEPSANLFNRFSLAAALAAGANTICPSLELNSQQLAETLQQLQADQAQPVEHAQPAELAELAAPAANRPWRLELPVYGRLRLMSSAYCSIGKNRSGCRACVTAAAADAGMPDPGRIYTLVDRREQRFMLQTHPRTCHTDLLNADILSVPEWLAELTALLARSPGQSPAMRARLYFLDETARERRQLVDNYHLVLQSFATPAIDAADQAARSVAGRLDCRLTQGHMHRGV
jgi:hypothetical protein